MIRETLVRISEGLFYLTGGVPLLETIWFIPWVVIGVILLAAPVILREFSAILSVVFMIWFFPILMIVMSPGAIQGQMTQECKTVDGEMFANAHMNGKKIEPQTVTMRQCRYKDNYYGEFGEWEIKEVSKK